ncbi:hypothetical protein LshimejAT787_0406310 [Lyophyllum shimeji]|uniref:Uncharacterized protein n=1 Tax=Lyophyllum shimeji TaxID=47721 RepID=A0A9P3PKH9_LYOSH|nr:hypothetical protein LshimejAT787_0406310 [Lyophyllum shimeji]
MTRPIASDGGPFARVVADRPIGAAYVLVCQRRPSLQWISGTVVVALTDGGGTVSTRRSPHVRVLHIATSSNPTTRNYVFPSAEFPVAAADVRSAAQPLRPEYR